MAADFNPFFAAHCLIFFDADLCNLPQVIRFIDDTAWTIGQFNLLHIGSADLTSARVSKYVNIKFYARND